MSDFLRALGYSPALYWLAAAGTLLLLLASAWPHARPRAWGSPLAFGALLLLAMAAWRWPALLHYKPVNPDESQFLAAALTLLHGRFWWIDTGSSGPLTSLPLALPGLFGLPIDQATGRVIATLLTWGQVLFAWLTLRHVHGDRWARLLVLPLVGLQVFLLFWDFVPYCGELPPLFLCALAVWLGVTAFSTEGELKSRRRLIGAGVVLGLMPLSKSQSLPLGAAIGLALVAWTFAQPGAPLAARLRDVLRLFAAAAAGPILVIAGLWLSGRLPDVAQSYFGANLDYAQARAVPWSDSGYILRSLTDFSWGFGSFHYGLLLLVVAGLAGAHRSLWRPLLLGWLLLLATYLAVLTPGRLYPHYLLLLSLPLALLAGLLFGRLLNTPSATAATLWSLLFVGAGFVPQLADRVWDRHDLSRLVQPAAPWAKVAGFINAVKRPGDSLAVWGWRPELYVATQLPQATRESNLGLNPSPRRDYFWTRFLADLQASRPAFFVDSTGPEDFAYKNPAEHGHEIFPDLANHIRREYRPVNATGPMRVYVRRDLATP